MAVPAALPDTGVDIDYMAVPAALPDTGVDIDYMAVLPAAEEYSSVDTGHSAPSYYYQDVLSSLD